MSSFNEANTVEAFIRDLLCGSVTHHTAVGPGLARHNNQISGLGWHFLSQAAETSGRSHNAGTLTVKPGPLPHSPPRPQRSDSEHSASGTSQAPSTS